MALGSNQRRVVSKQELDAARARFVAAWGQMGATWGISRTMAEIHALLYIRGEPLNTDEIMDELSISRGNASMSLRSLVEWGIVSRVHKRGDRKEYFQAEQDVWALCRTIIRERLRREIHPLMTALFEVRDMTQGAGGSAEGVSEHNKRMDDLLELMQMIDRLGERFVGSDGRGLRLAASVLSKVP
ncbi:MAG: GbsR/MarR family transcriptional regulator [Phycisphaerales bacterium]